MVLFVVVALTEGKTGRITKNMSNNGQIALHSLHAFINNIGAGAGNYCSSDLVGICY